MFNDSSILVTGGTGSFGHKFAEMTLEKYNPKKIYKHYVFGDINDTTKIISCCHSFNTDKNRYDLSSILKENKYSFTRKELIEINSFFQRFLS